MTVPDQSDAGAIVQSVLGHTPESVTRFPEGREHWVFDVRLAGGGAVVVRLGSGNLRDFGGARHWSRLLRDRGVPLPEILAHGSHRGMPYLVLERLEGTDLGSVYPALTAGERRTIVEAVCNAQQRVGTLPPGPGYGWLHLPGDRMLASWRDVVLDDLVRSRERIASAGLIAVDLADQLIEHCGRFERAWTRTLPTPFLDDTTTRNVIVHNGVLSGIVDVDSVCFGDDLFVVGLTRASLLASGWPTDYTDHWCDILELDDARREMERFYTALFAVNLLSEAGLTFNGNALPIDEERMARLFDVVRTYLRYHAR